MVRAGSTGKKKLKRTVLIEEVTPAVNTNSTHFMCRITKEVYYDHQTLTLHHITSHHITSHRIASHRIASHRIAAQRIASHRIASHRIASHRIA